MVLDDCDVCMEYWVSNGSNMEGFMYLASNRHIPIKHGNFADNNSDTSSLEYCNDSDLSPDLHPDVLVPPPADTSMLSQPDQSHNITIPEDPAMPTPQYQNIQLRPVYNKSEPGKSGVKLQRRRPANWSSQETPKKSCSDTPQYLHPDVLVWPPPPPPQDAALPDTSMLSQPDQSHNITIPEENQTSMPPAMMGNDSTSTTTASVYMKKFEGLEPEKNASSAPGVKLQRRPANWSSQETHKMRCLQLQLYKAATTGDWKSAKIILGEHEVLKTAKIRRDSETALHVAVGCGPITIKFVEEFLNILTTSDLELTNMDGHTALGIAAKVGNLEAARLLVLKNPNLPNISSEGYTGFPIHCAAEYGHKKLLLFLLEVTTNKAYLIPGDHKYDGKKFFYDIMKAEFYDVALSVIKRDRNVSIWGASKGLNLLAESPSSFSFGRDTKFLKRFVEKCVPDSIIQEDSNTTWKIKLYHSLWKLCGKLVPPLNHTVERLLKYQHAVKLVSSFCLGESNFLDAGTSTTNSLVLKFKMPMLLAATNGIHEIIEEVTKKCPDAMWFYEHNNSDIFKQAIINRHPKVYNLLYELGDLYINTVRHSVDEKGGTMLNLAAYLAPRQRLNHISGAASQMQHEVQWYKEIENLVPLRFRNLRNGDGLTPRDVFLQRHQQLMAEAESWMKGTANSCTVSAALIATVVFAAAITVPGGNSGENGIPMFARNNAFLIFGVADALSLFTSCVSILMFLSILTSRYAEHDFLYALPKRLIIGLLALFVSIASMMVAFSATLYLVFGPHKLWILTSVVASAFLPVAIFASLQFSLLSEMVSSTYGSGMFRRKTSFSADRRENEFQRLDKAIDEDYDTEDVRLLMP
ncbi:unnamed protein product [Rhodiola kirilowii]